MACSESCESTALDVKMARRISGSSAQRRKSRKIRCATLLVRKALSRVISFLCLSLTYFLPPPFPLVASVGGGTVVGAAVVGVVVVGGVVSTGVSSVGCFHALGLPYRSSRSLPSPTKL